MVVGPVKAGKKVSLFSIHFCSVRMQNMLECECDTVQFCYCCPECCSWHMLQALCVEAAVISAVVKERLCIAKQT
jgi:hypothetical protein